MDWREDDEDGRGQDGEDGVLKGQGKVEEAVERRSKGAIPVTGHRPRKDVHSLHQLTMEGRVSSRGI